MVVIHQEDDFEPVESMDLTGGDISLDFVNTASGRDFGILQEKLHAPIGNRLKKRRPHAKAWTRPLGSGAVYEVRKNTPTLQLIVIIDSQTRSFRRSPGIAR